MNKIELREFVNKVLALEAKYTDIAGKDYSKLLDLICDEI